MGLTDNQKKLIQSISRNDIMAAKKCADACLTEDTTSKNYQFCAKYKTILRSSGSNMMELPHSLQGLLCVEDVSHSFLEGRYYLTNREKEVYETVISMKKVSERLLQMQIPYINSTLLYGKSGTGKTTFGKYIAYKTGLPFYYLNFSELMDSLMGGTSKNISKVFSYASSNPCVLMLDEIDCISTNRSSGSLSSGSGGEIARITITLMQEFDKLTNALIIIGATNRKDRIDEALLRRFSLKHEVKELYGEEIKEMVNRYLEDIRFSISSDDVSEVVKYKNQSVILNELIRKISFNIMKEVERDSLGYR